MTPKTVYLLDAYALIFRAYYAFIRNPRRDARGRDVSAIFGFTLSLQDLIEKYDPDLIAVAFDPPGGTFRHREYPEYKAQREATPEAIKQAVPLIKELLTAYRIPIIEVADYEADDVIGTLAKQAEESGYEVRMVTPDKDYGQLVTDKSRILRPSTSGGYEEMGPEEVCNKFGLKYPAQMIDYLGLVGDSADNIPGCKGIGPKGAEKLLTEYDTVENILNNSDHIEGATGKKIRQGKEDIIMSRYLAEICTEVPVTFDAEAYKREKPDGQAVVSLFEELQFRTLLKRVLPDLRPSGTALQPSPRTSVPVMGDLFDQPALSTDINDNKQSSEGSELSGDMLTTTLHTLADTPHEYRLVENEKEIDWLIDRMMRADAVAFDTETTDLDPLKAELVAMSFSIKEHEGYCLPFPADRKESEKLLEKLHPLFTDRNILKIGQNIKYDMQVLLNYGIEVAAPYFDTMVAHYLLWPDQRHGMDVMAEQLLGYRTMTFAEMTADVEHEKGTTPDLRQVETRKLCEYAAEDADITLQFYQYLKPLLERDELTKLMDELEMPLVKVLGDMERTGVKLDTAVLQRLEKELEQQLEEIEKKIYGLAGSAFNVNSSKQVGEILFDRLKIDGKPKKTKGGTYSTSEEVLEQLANRHPIVSLILDYRGTKKLLSTYVTPMPEMLYTDGKLHSSFNQTVASTGRLSSSNPNLQNIPIRTDQGRLIREAFVPDNEQCLFLSADYSQIELRLMAHLSGDRSLIDAFKAGQDIHRATAAKIFNVSTDEVTSDMRRQAKTANFGIIYGISAFGLSQRLNIPRNEASDLIKGYFATYPAVRAYMDRSIAEAKEKGYVSTLLGRRRYVEGINSANSVVRGNAERNAINAPIQGTAADIIKLAMNRIFYRMREEGLKSKMILQVHDELNFNVLAKELERIKQIVKWGMEGAMPDLRVPLVADMGVGANWLEAH